LADPGPDPVGYVPAVLLDGADYVDEGRTLFMQLARTRWRRLVWYSNRLCPAFLGARAFERAAFTVTGAHNDVAAVARYLKSEAQASSRIDPGLIPYGLR
jgi:hypothetical protein